MALTNSYFLVLLLALLLINNVITLPRTLLYPHGSGYDTILPKGDDISTPEIQLKVPITFFGQTYRSIFVNTNGILSFRTEIPTFFNIQFPLDYPVIAPLYTNVDTSASGYVSYRETEEAEVLSRASRNVRDSFSIATDFQATSVFIATWTDVGYHRNRADKVNTYQIAIISDGIDSYVEFLYPENGVQWIQSAGSESGLPDARAQAGLVSDDGRMFTLKGSGTDQILNVERWSNMNLPGQWIFHVGNIEEDGNAEQPDQYKTFEPDPSTIKSCAEGATKCHSKATCIDYDEGFCCVCKEGYYGNGKTCLKNDLPLRVAGKVKGNINGVQFEDLDLQSYVVMSDGRVYTAVSKISPSIGYSMQCLNIIGGVIGWLFAKPVGNTKNGYQLTGGIFNHSATLTFTNTGDEIKIWNKYTGLNVFDQLRLETEIIGHIPDISSGVKITIPEYTEEYVISDDGVIQSQLAHYVVAGGEEKQIPFSVQQTIKYSPCEFAEPLNITTFKVKVSKSFISYEHKEQIIRYGMSSKVSPINEIDPCIEGKSTCGHNSYCVAESDSFRCVCQPGYQQIYQGTEIICVDVNECLTGFHYCDVNARCYNEEGSFLCVCNDGYTGDGRTCTVEVQPCNGRCSTNAQCVLNYEGNETCQCNPGFEGDGINCVEKRYGCDILNYCSPYATCQFTSEGNYDCFCNPGYHGDGKRCEPDVESTSNTDNTGWEIDPTTPIQPETTIPPSRPEEEEEQILEKCLLGVCWCPEGHEKKPGTSFCVKKQYKPPSPEETSVLARPLPQCFDSNTCICPKGFYYSKNSEMCFPVPGIIHETMGPTGNSLSCYVVNNCHPHALCVFVSTTGQYQCQCSAGYEGDGYECTESDVSCQEVDICDIHATCQYDDNLKKAICVCNQGYQGDGTFCTAKVQPSEYCTSQQECGVNADCVYNAHSLKYQCDCLYGYERDANGECKVVIAKCGSQICVENAQCIYDHDYKISYCQCISGYIGDGVNECRAQPAGGCNVLNNCGLYASCEYDQQSFTYKCKCNNGYYGDGLTCTTERTCDIDPYICHQYASCIVGRDRRYICECKHGFKGNGTFCAQIAQHDGNFLLLTQGMAMLRVPFNPTKTNPGKPIQFQYSQLAIGIDVDCYEGKVYWSDILGHTIKSSNYDGSAPAVFLEEDIGSPEGISIDWVSRNIFWTDSNKDTIEVANLDTKIRRILFSNGLVNPRGIAVHPIRGKIFWSDWNRDFPKLEWSNMDGTDRQIFLQGDHVKLPNSLAIDWDTDHVCYADAGTKNIECVNIDTRQPQTVVANITYPFGLAITRDHFYWTDWITKKVELIEKRTLTEIKSMDVPLGGMGNKLYGIAAVPDHCPGLSNVCQYINGQCPSNNLCLLNGQGGRTCLCGINAENPYCNDLGTK